MRVVVLLLAVAVGIGLVVVIIGYLLPVRHEATVAATIPATPDAVWEVLTNPANYPQWRGDVTSVEILPTDSGHVAWREQGKNGAIAFVVEQAERPRRLVTRITDKSLPFGGSWEYLVTAEGSALMGVPNARAGSITTRRRRVMGHHRSGSAKSLNSRPA